MSNREDIEQLRWEVRWAAEVSSRYHRRRAAWLNNVDFILNVFQMLSATAAFVELARGAPSLIAAIGTAVIALCALIQILGRLGKAALDHELLMKEWCDLLTEAETTDPDSEVISKWMRRRGELNKIHVGELRALAIATENETASALGVSGRQRSIGRLQWILMHILTFQRHFPAISDLSLPAPKEPSIGN